MRTDHNPNLSMMKGKTKSYDTLSDEIMQFMPFKMEFLNGNKMFVDALSRLPRSTCAVSHNPLKLFSSTSTPLLDLDILLAQQKRDPALVKAIMYHQGHISLSDAPPFCQHKIKISSANLFNFLQAVKESFSCLSPFDPSSYI